MKDDILHELLVLSTLITIECVTCVLRDIKTNLRGLNHLPTQTCTAYMYMLIHVYSTCVVYMYMCVHSIHVHTGMYM